MSAGFAGAAWTHERGSTTPTTGRVAAVEGFGPSGRGVCRPFGVTTAFPSRRDRCGIRPNGAVADDVRYRVRVGEPFVGGEAQCAEEACGFGQVSYREVDGDLGDHRSLLPDRWTSPIR